MNIFEVGVYKTTRKGRMEVLKITVKTLHTKYEIQNHFAKIYNSFIIEVIEVPEFKIDEITLPKVEQPVVSNTTEPKKQEKPITFITIPVEEHRLRGDNANKSKEIRKLIQQAMQLRDSIGEDIVKPYKDNPFVQSVYPEWKNSFLPEGHLTIIFKGPISTIINQES